MSFRTWFAALQVASTVDRLKREWRRSPRRRRPDYGPPIEALECRVLLTTLTVTNLSDNNIGATLRNEIATAKSGDTIIFAKGLSGAIGLYEGELFINKNLDIEGPGANKLAIGYGASRVFEVAAGAQVTLSGLTIEGGNGRYGGYDPSLTDGLGGGILNWGTLVVSSCALSSNSNSARPDSLGGAVYNAGILTLDNSTVTNNTADSGGGIYNDAGGTLTIHSSKITHNRAWDLYNLGTLTTDKTSNIGAIGP
jgi:hypothetical protein